MGPRSKFGRIAGVATVALAGMALTAPAASAVGGFHFIKIREVFIGGGNPHAAFVELQTYAPGQANIAGHSVTFYDETGVPLAPYPITSDVPNGDNQRSILIGGPSVTPTPDFPYDIGAATQTFGPGGAVCFDNLDCVAWGNFAGMLPSPPGSPAPAIPAGSSLERSIAPGCATLLEDFDDTNVSLTDFFLQATPNPRNNATAPTEQSCAGPPTNPGGGPDTKIDRGPKKKTKKKNTVFEFSSTSVGVTFECSVDGNAPKGANSFGPCTSPFPVKVKKGRHNFRVRAVLNGVPDGSPAEQSWRVKKPRK